MTTTPLILAARISTRAAVVMVLVVVLMLTGTGVATARWIIAATTTTPVTAGSLTAELTGTTRLSALNIEDNQYTTPVELTLHNPNSVTVDYTLEFSASPGTLDRAEVELAVWKPAGTTCPDLVPATATASPLSAPPTLEITGATAGSSTVVCAATRFTGTPFGSAEKSLTITPTLTAELTTGDWTASARDDFTFAMAPAPAPVAEGTLDCADRTIVLGLVNLGGVELSWSPVPGATSYQITSSTGQPIDVTPTITSTAVNVVLTTRDIGDDERNTWVYVSAVGPTGSSVPVRQDVRVGAVLLLPLLGVAVRCP